MQEDYKKKSKKFKLNLKKVFLGFLQMFFIILFIISAMEMYRWFIDNKKNREIQEEMSSFVSTENVKDYNDQIQETIITVDFDNLKEKNPDTVAWIKLNNTNIEYPIVKTTNNSYYLNHSFDKSYNLAGWIFSDYKNKFDDTDKNIVIYGHNMKDGSMFGNLKNVLKEEWYNNDDNRNITFITENGYYKYRIFSIYEIENEEYYIKTEFKNNEFKSFINTIKRRSNKDLKEEVNENDQILTLSTCASNNKYRLVIHAKQIQNIVNDN